MLSTHFLPLSRYKAVDMLSKLARKRLRNVGIFTSLLIGLASAVSLAQAPLAPGFEVASIRQIEYTEQVRNEVLAGTRRPRTTITDTRVSITYTSLMEIVRRAFRVVDQPWRLDAPDWLNEVRVDLQATMPAAGRGDQVPEMLQALLAQRFGLVTRRESRTVSGRALVVNGATTKLREMTLQELEELARLRESGKFEAQTIRTETSALTFTSTPTGSIQAEVKGMTMSELARELTGTVGQPVIDRTGLAGRYHFTLELSLPDLPPLGGRGAGVAGSGPAAGALDPRAMMMTGMVDAVHRIGLRLESDRIPTEVIVVDKMSRTPTPD